MARHDRLSLAALLFLGVAACGSGRGAAGTAGPGGGVSGAGGGEAGGGAGGMPDGCVDIYVSPALLDEPERWQEHGRALQSGVWIQQGTVQVAWQANELLGVDAWGPTHPWLVISQFDAADGQHLSNTLIDVIPAGIDSDDAAYGQGTGGPNGTYAVRVGWTDATEWHDAVLVGSLFTGDFSVAELPESSAGGCHVGWDGEAFAFHGGTAGPNGGTALQVARVTAEGSILLSFTTFGTTPNVCYPDLGYKIDTVPETGITYVFDASNQNYLSGHLRDGTPLPGTETGPLVIEPNGFDITNTSTPSLGATTDGLWVAWKQADAVQTSKVLAQWLTPEGVAEGPAFELRGEGEGIEGLPRLHAVLGRPGGAGYFAGYLSAYLFGRDHDGQLPADPVIAYEDQTPTGAIPVQEVRLLEDDEGTPWLYWNEQKDDDPSQRRVMKLAPGCVYKALM